MVGSGVLKKKKCIIDKIKAKYWHTTHTFEIEIPKMVEHVLQID